MADPRTPKEAAEKIRKRVCAAIGVLVVLGSIVAVFGALGPIDTPLLVALLALLALVASMYALTILGYAASYQLEFKNYKEPENSGS